MSASLFTLVTNPKISCPSVAALGAGSGSKGGPCGQALGVRWKTCSLLPLHWPRLLLLKGCSHLRLGIGGSLRHHWTWNEELGGWNHGPNKHVKIQVKERINLQPQPSGVPEPRCWRRPWSRRRRWWMISCLLMFWVTRYEIMTSLVFVLHVLMRDVNGRQRSAFWMPHHHLVMHEDLLQTSSSWQHHWWNWW